MVVNPSIHPSIYPASIDLNISGVSTCAYVSGATITSSYIPVNQEQKPKAEWVWIKPKKDKNAFLFITYLSVKWKVCVTLTNPTDYHFSARNHGTAARTWSKEIQIFLDFHPLTQTHTLCPTQHQKLGENKNTPEATEEGCILSTSAELQYRFFMLLMLFWRHK